MILIKKLSRIDKDLAFCYYDRAAGTYRGTWGTGSYNFFGKYIKPISSKRRGAGGADYTTHYKLLFPPRVFNISAPLVCTHIFSGDRYNR